MLAAIRTMTVMSWGAAMGVAIRGQVGLVEVENCRFCADRTWVPGCRHPPTGKTLKARLCQQFRGGQPRAMNDMVFYGAERAIGLAVLCPGLVGLGFRVDATLLPSQAGEGCTALQLSVEHATPQDP